MNSSFYNLFAKVVFRNAVWYFISHESHWLSQFIHVYGRPNEQARPWHACLRHGHVLL